MCIILFSVVQLSPTDDPITSRGQIFCTYLKGWFILDLVAIMPFNEIISLLYVERENNTQNYSLAAKVIRLSRIFKIFKFLRIFKLLKDDSPLKKWMNKQLAVTVAVERMIKSLLIFSLIVHMLCCAWIYEANEAYVNDGPSWVWANGY